jgi:hypothetical protein
MIEAGLKLKRLGDLGGRFLQDFAVPFIAKRFGEQTNVFCGDDCPRAVLRADSSGDAGIAAATASLRHLQRGTTAVLLFWQSRKKAGVANADQRLRHLTNYISSYCCRFAMTGPPLPN